MWNKYTAFEIAHRAPMMIHVPGLIEQVNYEHRRQEYDKYASEYFSVDVF